MSKKVVVRHVIELDDDAVVECFNSHLEALGGKDCWIDDKGIVWEEDDYGHGSSTSNKVSKPSEVQVLALKLEVALNKAAAKAKKEVK